MFLRNNGIYQQVYMVPKPRRKTSSVWLKFADVSEVLVASIIALMMEAASTSETSVNFYQITWHNNPEGSHLHTHH
jgi:hypothetical protein